MKWAKVIEQNIVWEWRKHYISYKPLKKIIKKLKQALDNNNNEGFSELQFQFTELVEKELDEVEFFYKQRESQLIKQFDSLQSEEKSNELYQLEKYAYLNGEGFRKILKKYDKKLSLNASSKYSNVFKSKTFYTHHQIRQLHASLSNNYEPVICSYSLLNEYDYKYEQPQYEYEYESNYVLQFLLKYFEISRHPKICILRVLFLFIILLFVALAIGDIYFSFKLKGKNVNYLSQKITLKNTQFNAFIFPLIIFSLCSMMGLIICCNRNNKLRLLQCALLTLLFPVILTLLFGLSPIILILVTIILINSEGYASIINSYNVSYEMMFMHQVNNYFYHQFLKQNQELIKHNYYEFNFTALRILFLSLLHLYDGDAANDNQPIDENIKNMYFQVINEFIINARDKNVKRWNRWKCLKYFNKIFLQNGDKKFYFSHVNNDQQDSSSWKSLSTSFQSYCFLCFGIVGFGYILWWISFGWSAYSLFANFEAFAVLLQFWALRDGICIILCAIGAWVRYKYMFYLMLYDYSWFHRDLRYLILDKLIINHGDGDGNGFIRRNMKFNNRFDSDNNQHCKFVMDHLMPILRHCTIEKILSDVCFDQLWMVDIILQYSCDFQMYVIPCVPSVPCQQEKIIINT